MVKKDSSKKKKNSDLLRLLHLQLLDCKQAIKHAEMNGKSLFCLYFWDDVVTLKYDDYIQPWKFFSLWEPSLTFISYLCSFYVFASPYSPSYI